MSTRSATIIRQTTYCGKDAETEEIMRFYRHFDGYPEGHGLEIAKAIESANTDTPCEEEWLADVLKWFLILSPYAPRIKFEPRGCQHGNLDYLYVIDGAVDRRWSRVKSGKLPITISVYRVGWNESYSDAEKNEPIFSGTAYEYIERFGASSDGR